MIDSASDLAALIDRARDAGAIALDTEFVWERTYYPRLGVVQLGLGESDVHLIDAAALDLTPLASLLEDPSITLILHDAAQDLQILARAAGATPRAVFDTQLAGGFVGIGATNSLQDLVAWASGITLKKGATRSDWLQRPLTEEQRHYAAEDVRYLHAARRRLLDAAASYGRTAWVMEEMRGYDDPALTEENDPMEAVARVRGRGLGRLSGRQRAVLRSLAAWREREARRLDRPRRHVLPDDALIDVAKRGPSSRAELSKTRLTDRQLASYADGLLTALEEGRAAEPEPRSPRGALNGELMRARLRAARALTAGRCATAEMDEPMVATKSDLQMLVAAGPDADPERHALLRGWRREFVGAALVEFLRGDLAVRLNGPNGWPEPV